LCFGFTTTALKYRANPSVTAAQLGVWENGSRLHAIEVQFVQDGSYINEWALLSNGTAQGWSAAYYRGAEYFKREYTDACMDVWYPAPAFLMHTVPGANGLRLMAFETGLRVNHLLSGSKNYTSTDYCLSSLANRQMCILRFPPDCPEGVGTADPRQSAYAYMEARNGVAQAFSNWRESDLFYIELTNECNFDGHLNWWRDWMMAVLDYADEHNWPRLAMPGLGVGSGSYHMFLAWKDPLMRNHARGGVLATHNYSPPEHCGGDGSLSGGDEWCAFRHRLNYFIIHDVIGYDVRIAITELAPGWGNTQVTQAVINDFGTYFGMVKDDPGLHSLSAWIYAYHPAWSLANLEGWEDPMIVALTDHALFLPMYSKLIRYLSW
jgi:hypothetical protein